MDSIRLRQPVLIRGKDIFGRESSICFCPETDREWVWKVGENKSVIIEPSVVDIENRRLKLSAYGKKLEFYEHIGVLRYFGLVGIGIQSSQWPPFHGRTLELWDAIEPNSSESSEEGLCQYYTVSRSVRWTYPNKRGKYVAFTEIRPPSRDLSLTLDIFCSYPGIGIKFRTFSLPDLSILQDICTAHSQGWPLWLYGLSRVAGLCGWPHHKNIAWKQELEDSSVIDQFLLHRAQDILGALSLLCRDGVFVGHITSYCSGHEADFHAVREADNLIIKL